MCTLYRNIQYYSKSGRTKSLDIDWRAMARELKNKKFGNSKAVDAKSKARQIRYLQYKGHAISDIMSVLE
jgi:SOS response regulatory protein OraA/RecX